MTIESDILIKIILAFVIGGSSVTLLTAVVDKLGDTLGGIMSGIPSNATASLLFIYFSIGLEETVVAADAALVGFAASLIFMVAYLRFHSLLGAIKSYIFSIAIWVGLVFAASGLGIESLWASIVILIAIVIPCHLIMRRLPVVKARKHSVSLESYAIRLVMSGSIIAFTVFIANSIGSTWGGYFAGFPAAFTSIIIILERSQGIRHLNAVMKHSAIGMLGSIVYFIAFHYTAIWTKNIALTIVSSYVFSIPFAYGLYHYRK